MKVFVLTGPTGVGKSEAAVILARKFGLDLISADSRAIYRYLDIGAAKPPPELRQEVRFHLIDFVDPREQYSAADFARDALKVMQNLRRVGRRFIIVGGAGFYLRALFSPLFEAPPANLALRARLQVESTETLYRRLCSTDPPRARELHPNDRQRIIRALEVNELTGKTFSQLAQSQKEFIVRSSEFQEPKTKNQELFAVYAVLTMERKQLYHRIEKRFDQMMASGLLEEVRRLKEMGLCARSAPAQSAERGTKSCATNAYGYAELLRYLQGEISLKDAIALAKKKTKEYARRQLTWLRGLKGAHWFEVTTPEDTALRLEPLLLDALGVAP